jgi:hypothetical protein
MLPCGAGGGACGARGVRRARCAAPDVGGAVGRYPGGMATGTTTIASLLRRAARAAQQGEQETARAAAAACAAAAGAAAAALVEHGDERDVKLATAILAVAQLAVAITAAPPDPALRRAAALAALALRQAARGHDAAAADADTPGDLRPGGQRLALAAADAADADADTGMACRRRRIAEQDEAAERADGGDLP